MSNFFSNLWNNITSKLDEKRNQAPMGMTAEQFENRRSELAKKDISKLTSTETPKNWTNPNGLSYETAKKRFGDNLKNTNSSEYRLTDKDYETINNNFGGYFDPQGNRLNEEQTNQYKADVEKFQTNRDNINAKIQSLTKDLQNGSINENEYALKANQLEMEWNATKSEEERLKSYQFKQGFDYYDSLKGEDIEEAKRFENYVASFNDSIFENLGNMEAAAFLQTLGTIPQVVSVLDDTVFGKKTTAADEITTKLNNNINEIRSYVLNGKNGEGIGYWGLRTVDSLLPMANSILLGSVMGNMLNIGDVQTFTNTFTNVYLGLQNGGQVAKQRLAEGNSYGSSVLNGTLHGVITGLVEGLDAGRVTNIFFGGAGQNMLGVGLFSQAPIKEILMSNIRAGVSEGAEEVIESLADFCADSVQNTLDRFFFGGQNQIDVETLSLGSLAEESILAFAGACLLGVPQSGQVMINSKRMYNASVDAMEYFEEVKANALKNNDVRSINEANTIIDYINKEQQAYLDKSKVGKKIETESDVVPKVTLEETQNAYLNAARIDVASFFEADYESQRQLQSLTSLTEQSLVQRGLLAQNDYGVKKGVSAQDYIQMDYNQREKTKNILNLANKLKLDVNIDPNLSTGDGSMANGRYNQYTDMFDVNPNVEMTSSSATIESTLMHEITHRLEKTKGYSDLKKMIMDNFGSQEEVNAELARIRSLYEANGVKDVNAESEFVAKQIEKTLGNEDFIEKMANYEGGDFISKLYERIKSATNEGFDSKIGMKFIESFEKIASTTQAQNVNVPAELRYSITSLFQSSGLEISKNENGTLEVFKNGKKVDNVTQDMVNDSPIGKTYDLAVKQGNITQEEAQKRIAMYTDILNLVKNVQDPDAIWAISGSLGFTKIDSSAVLNDKEKTKTAPLKSNADKQYGLTFDVTTICNKTQGMIDVMSQTMLNLGRGLTEKEIVDVVYKELAMNNEPVPCPVCYVFSRWVGTGSLLDKIINYQEKYTNADTKAIQKDFDKLSAQVDKIVEQKGKSGTQARDEVYKNLVKRRAELQSKENLLRTQNKELSKEDAKEVSRIESDLGIMDAWSWIKNVRLQDDYVPVPKEILLDLNKGEEFANRYPKAWKYRTTRGPAMGKAITPYSSQMLGQTILGIAGSAESIRELGNARTYSGINANGKKGVLNPFLNPRNLTKKATEVFERSKTKARRQNLIGGSRIQSTSDFRFEYVFDYILHLSELEMVGSNAQEYTKVPESVPMMASANVDVNCSLMPKGWGWYEVSKDTQDAIELDGKYYKLDYSNVTGMNEKDAFRLSGMYDSVQPIMVGINDTHIELCLKEVPNTVEGLRKGGITFIIPYHSSGNNEVRYQSMMRSVNENVEDGARTDYSKVQEDKKISNPTTAQLNAREVRMDILTGKLKDVKLDNLQLSVLNSNPYLNDLYRRFYVEGVDDTCYLNFQKADTAEKVFPFEYWDKTSTINNADINGKRFVEYLETLGMKPRFEQFSDKHGYWTMLIDRAMYDLDGNYRDQKSVSLANFSTDYLYKNVMQEGVVQPSAQYSGDTSKYAQSVLKKIRGQYSIDDQAITENDLNMVNSIVHGRDPYYYSGGEHWSNKGLHMKSNPNMPSVMKIDAYLKKFQKPINKENFMNDTFAIFDEVSEEHLAKNVDLKAPDYVSRSSVYWYTDNGVFRMSDHWGTRIRSCDWYLQGFNNDNASDVKDTHNLENGYVGKNNNGEYSGGKIGFASWNNFRHKPELKEVYEALNGNKQYSIDDTYSTDGKKVAFTNARINELVDENEDKWGANQFLDHGKSKAYITWMSPKDYLKLTASENTIGNYYESTKTEEYAGGSIDFERMRNRPANRASSYIYLTIDEDNNVVSQEGRHRSAMFDRDGYSIMPVLIYDQYGDTDLDGQTVTIGGWNLPTSTEAALTQITKANRQKILDEFGDGANANVQYSVNDIQPRENGPFYKRNIKTKRSARAIEKINSGQLLTENEFYDIYSVHKVRIDDKTDIEKMNQKINSIIERGFIGGMVMPTSTFRYGNSPTFGIGNMYNPKKGDVEVLVSNDYVDIYGGDYISNGYTPHGFEVLTMKSDDETLYDAYRREFKNQNNVQYSVDDNALVVEDAPSMKTNPIPKRSLDAIAKNRETFIKNAEEWLPGYETLKAEYPNMDKTVFNKALYDSLIYGEISKENRKDVFNDLTKDNLYLTPEIAQKYESDIDAFQEEVLNTFANEEAYKAGKYNKTALKRAITENNAFKSTDIDYSYMKNLDGAKLSELTTSIKEGLKVKYQQVTDTLLGFNKEYAIVHNKNIDHGVSYFKTPDQNIKALANGNKEVHGYLNRIIREELLNKAADRKVEIMTDAKDIVQKIKTLGITEGSKEAKAVQYLMEGHTEALVDKNKLPNGAFNYVVFNEKILDRDYNYRLPNGKIASESIKEAAKLLSESYDVLYKQVTQTQLLANGDVEGDAKDQLLQMVVKINNALEQIELIKKEIVRDGSKVSTQSAYETKKREYNTLIKQYNTLVDKYTSGDLTRRHLTPYRENYSHHIMKKSLKNAISSIKDAEYLVPTELAGITDFTNPNTAFATFSLKQEGYHYDPDAIASYVAYVNEASDVISNNPVILELRKFRDALKENARDIELNKLASWLHDYANVLSGKRNNIDREVQKYIGAKGMKVIKTLNSYAKGAALAFNLRSGLVQAANIPNGLGILNQQGGKDYVKDVAEGLRKYINNDQTINLSTFINERYFDFETGNKTFSAKLMDVSDKVLSTLDKVVAKLLWHSAYAQSQRLDPNADHIAYADALVRGAIAGRTKTEVPVAMQSETLNLIMPFQVENNNLWQTLKDQKTSKAFNAILTYNVTAFVFNMVIKAITNGDDEVLSEFLTPIYKEITKALRGEKDGNEAAKDMFWGEIGEFISMMPFGSQATSLAVGDNGETIFGDYNPSRYGMTNIGLSGIGNAITNAMKANTPNEEIANMIESLVGGYVTGGKQLTRTIGGLQSMGALPDFTPNGFEATPVNYTRSGNVSYVNDQSNPLDWYRATLFGKYNTSAARKYYDNGTKGLSEKQTRIFEALANIGRNKNESYQDIKDVKNEDVSLRDKLIEDGTYRDYLDNVTDKYEEYANSFDYKSGEDLKTFTQFASTYGISKADLDKDKYQNFYDKYEVEDDQKVISDAMEIKNVSNALGTTIQNSGSALRRKAYEDAGIYEDIVEFINDNALDPSDFGLNKTVIGYDETGMDKMMAKIEGKKYEEEPVKTKTVSKTTSKSSSRTSGTSVSKKQILSMMQSSNKDMANLIETVMRGYDQTSVEKQVESIKKKYGLK